MVSFDVSILAGQTLILEFLKAGGGVIAMRLLGAALGFAVVAVLARMGGADVLGLYTLAMSVLMIGTIPVSYGWATMFLRRVSSATNETGWAEAKGMLIFGQFVALAVAVLALLFCWLLREPLAESLSWSALFALCLVLFFDQISALRAHALRGFAQPVRSMVPETVVRPALFCAALIVLYGTNVAIDAEPVFLGLTVAGFCALLLGQVFMNRAAPLALKTANPHFAPKRWLLVLSPIMGAQGLALLMAQADVLMLGWFRTLEEVGIYRIALQLGLLCGMGYAAINMIMSQRFAHALAKDDREALEKEARLSAQLAFGTTLAAALMIMPLARPVIKVAFGEGFEAALAPLAVLLFTQVANAFFGMPRVLLMMAGHETIIFRSTLLALCLAILLGALLIPLFGAFGAALSLFFPILFLNFFFWRRAWKTENVDTSILGKTVVST